MVPRLPWVAALLILTTGASSTGLRAADDEASLDVIGHYGYPLNDASHEQCDYQSRSCAPLSDVWGTGEGGPDALALVGVLNGVSIVNATHAESLSEVAFFPGCLTEWRDIKTLDKYAFIVEDYTAFCGCRQQPCEKAINLTLGGNWTDVAATEGTFSVPLESVRPLRGSVVPAEPLNGCGAVNNTEVAGQIALIQRGECTFAEKTLNAQRAGAVAVIIYNNREDEVPPSMGGEGTGITIPSLMVRHSVGKQLVEDYAAELAPEARLAWRMRDNPLYGRADGVVVVKLDAEGGPEEVLRTREWFSFAHNIFIEEDRKLLWACGMSCHATEEECDDFRDGNGGIMVLDISVPEKPTFIAQWQDVYIHDVVVTEFDGRKILYGAGIYDSSVYRFDVTDPRKLGATAVYWKTPAMAHNTWPTPDQHYVYVTHEDSAMPVTVWDVSDLTNIQYVTNISFHSSNGTIPHNVQFQGNRAYLGYYSEGVTVWDISTPTHPEMIAHRDTSPQYYNGFHGVWGTYPFADGKHVYASDIEGGLFYLELSNAPPLDDGGEEGEDGGGDGGEDAGDGSPASPDDGGEEGDAAADDQAAFSFNAGSFALGLVAGLVLMAVAFGFSARATSGARGPGSEQRLTAEQRNPLVRGTDDDDDDFDGVGDGSL